MLPRVLSCFVVCAGLFVSLSAAAQESKLLQYEGTIGEQHVTFQLEVADDALRSGHYGYRGQPSDIRIVDIRRFGTTLVLQDEDSNILHLHFEDSAGEKASGFPKAAMLEGTLDRGELDLPVKLVRQERK